MPQSSVALRRLTTEYIEHEDRFRLAGETEQGHLMLWLSLRMAQRLVPALVRWLEQQRAEPQRTFTQFEFGRQTIQPQHQEVLVLANWLITAIDVTTTAERVLLTFKNAEGQAAGFEFTAASLRQWLELLHEIYLGAQWPLDIWPVWLTEQPALFNNAQAATWH